MVRLVLPSVKYKNSFLAAVREFGKENNRYVLSVDMPVREVSGNFSAYVKRIRNLSKGIGLVEGYVPETVYWLIDGNKFIGRVSIRHRLTKSLRLVGGHIGYEVRPTERKKGYGKMLLELALLEAQKLGIKKALVTCDGTNLASRKIIEHCGGILENAGSQGKGKPKKLRFWIQPKKFKKNLFGYVLYSYLHGDHPPHIIREVLQNSLPTAKSNFRLQIANGSSAYLT